MRLRHTWQAYEFACRSAECRPPTSGGTGGSSPKKGSQISEDSVAARIQARREATSARLQAQTQDPPKRSHGLKTSWGADLTDDMLKRANASFIEVSRPDTFSGHKAHVYALDIPGTNLILQRMAGDIEKRGWGVKVATQQFHDFTRDGHKQAGKAVTVYFPKKARVEEDTARLVSLMSDLPAFQRTGIIQGDKMVGNGVGTRYELSKNAPDRDLDPVEYHQYYQPA